MQEFYAGIRGKDGVVTIPVKDIVESTLLNKILKHRPVLEKKNISQFKLHLKANSMDRVIEYLNYREQSIQQKQPYHLFDDYYVKNIKDTKNLISLKNSNPNNPKQDFESITIYTVNGFPLVLDRNFFLNLKLDLVTIEHVDERHINIKKQIYRKNNIFLENSNLNSLFNEIINNIDKARIGNEIIKYTQKRKIHIDFEFDKVIGTNWNGTQQCKIVRIGLNETGEITTMFPVSNFKFYAQNYFILT